MATKGTAKNIIVGAAQLFVADEDLEYFTVADGAATAGVYFPSSISGSADVTLPSAAASASYADTLETTGSNANYITTGKTIRNVGYTMNGLELQFQPDFGEVTVDQVLDVARMYKQGMQVNLATAFAESTLENLVVAIAAKNEDYTESGSFTAALTVTAGDIGDGPVERALIAVGPGSGDPTLVANSRKERVYTAYRALSIENVTVNAKRDEPSMFEVSFRLLPAGNGVYGKIVDRVYTQSGNLVN